MSIETAGPPVGWDGFYNDLYWAALSIKTANYYPLILPTKKLLHAAFLKFYPDVPLSSVEFVQVQVRIAN